MLTGVEMRCVLFDMCTGWEKVDRNMVVLHNVCIAVQRMMVLFCFLVCSHVCFHVMCLLLLAKNVCCVVNNCRCFIYDPLTNATAEAMVVPISTSSPTY